MTITRKLASEYGCEFKIRSNKIVFSDGELYGCYNWVDLGDLWLKEYRGFTKQKGVFSERKKTGNIDEILRHISHCPVIVYKLLSKDRTRTTKWCASIEEAMSVKRMMKEPESKNTGSKPKYELHQEEGGLLWIVCYHE